MSSTTDSASGTATGTEFTFAERLIREITSYAHEQGMHDPGYVKALSQWLAGVEQHADKPMPQVDHVAPVNATEVEELMIEVEKRRVDHIVVQLKGHYLEQAWNLGLDAARRAAEYHEVIPQGIEWDIDTRRGTVIGVHPAPPPDAAAVVASSKTLIEADDELLREIAAGAVAEELTQSIPEEFVVDLAVLLLELMEGERAIVQEMLTDKDLAQRIAARDWAPKPLKYLAGICAA